MRLTIVEVPVEKEIALLETDVRLLSGVNVSEEGKLKLREKKERLDILTRYKKMWDKRADYDKIKHLKRRDPEAYDVSCQSLIKDIKGVTYISKGQFFRIRKTTNGIQKSLGSVDTPQDAIDILKLYI